MRSNPSHHAVRLVVASILGVAAISISFASTSSVDYGGYRPHYQGFGVTTPGGRGGAVLRVTNLEDSGPGSFRAAVEAEGPRIVIFETSGTIRLSGGPIYIKNPFLTVAGQTAPSPGINITRFGLYVDTHDVVLQHFRIREGDDGWQPPPQALYSLASSGQNVIFDHMSVGVAAYQSFAVLDYANIGATPTDVSLLDSIIAFPLSKMSRDAASSGYGAGMGHATTTVATGHYSYARNLFVHSSYRSPIVGAGRQAVVNDVVYGSGPFDPTKDQTWGFQMWWPHQYYEYINSNPGRDTESVFANTLTISSNGTGSGQTAGSGPEQKAFSFAISQNNLDYQQNHVLLRGNLGPGITGPTGAGQKTGINWVTTDRCGESGKGCGVDATNAAIWYDTDPDWYKTLGFKEIASSDVAESVFNQAGARPLDRDAIDVLAVSQARAGLANDKVKMGSRITSQSEIGGYPVLAQNAVALKVPENPNAVAPGQTFRTNIEMWLESMAQAVEPKSGTLGAPGAVRIERK